MNIISRLKLLPTTLLLLLALPAASVALVAPSAYAAPGDDLCSGASIDLDGGGDCNKEEAEESINGALASVINILSVVIGVVAVIFIIIGGFKYVTSGGDSGKVGSAKNTIIYALVGLVFVALAQVLVKFVLKETTQK